MAYRIVNGAEGELGVEEELGRWGELEGAEGDARVVGTCTAVMWSKGWV
ncbi:MAG: hypothetical protein PUK59_00135 [Actinomycetaceae bacterium]|nr:hypothetical protein [Actinomycetaceae bacterium]MDY5854244.1 hypothetical protein [Arcanobacterium sp.]